MTRRVAVAVVLVAMVIAGLVCFLVINDWSDMALMPLVFVGTGLMATWVAAQSWRWMAVAAAVWLVAEALAILVLLLGAVAGWYATIAFLLIPWAFAVIAAATVERIAQDGESSSLW